MPNCDEYGGRYLPGMERVIKLARESGLVTKCTIEPPKTRSGLHADWKVGVRLKEGTYLQARNKDGILVVSGNVKHDYQTARFHTDKGQELKNYISENA